jgi:Flp pilus assembly pilin Flp
MKYLSACFVAVHLRVLLAQQWVRQQFVVMSGQGLVEYSLVLVLIAVTCVAILSALGTTVSKVWYQQIIGAFD